MKTIRNMAFGVFLLVVWAAGPGMSVAVGACPPDITTVSGCETETLVPTEDEGFAELSCSTFCGVNCQMGYDPLTWNGSCGGYDCTCEGPES